MVAGTRGALLSAGVGVAPPTSLESYNINYSRGALFTGEIVMSVPGDDPAVDVGNSDGVKTTALLSVSGSVGFAADTVDFSRALIVRPVVADLFLTLPNPSYAPQVFSLDVINIGNGVTTTVNGVSLAVNETARFVWFGFQWSVTVSNNRVVVMNTDYTALAIDRSIAFKTISAPRTVTLPAANVYPTGTTLFVIDESGDCNETNAITLSAVGSDHINGLSNTQITAPYGYSAMQSDGVAKWTIVFNAMGTFDGHSLLDLRSSNNLSDLASAVTARTNLGLATVAATGAYADLTGKPTLGTSSTHATGDFVQTANNLSDISSAAAARGNLGLATVAATGAYADLTGKPTLGTVAAYAVGAFVLVTNNLSDIANPATARTNLGLATVAATGAYSDLTGKPTLGTSSTHATGDFALVVNNLSDLPSAVTARTNLGLATVAATGAYADLTGKPTLGTAAALTAGAASGVATLDSGGHIPISQLPAAIIGALQFQSTWNASTNSPALASSSGTKGYFYVVDTAGTTSLDGLASWSKGDWAIFDGTVWRKVDGVSSEVLSVAGRTGSVVLANTDISGFGTSSTHATGDFAQTANNLSDLPSAVTARTNLGLATVAATGAYSDLTGKPTLGTSSTHATGDFALVVNNLSDLPSAVTARTNLGLATVAATGAYADLTGKPLLGTVAAYPVGSFLQVGSNLSDLANLNTARANLTAAKSGSNSDITSLSGLTTALSIAQGGTGALTAGAALTSLGALSATATALPGTFLASSLTSAAGGAFGTGAYAAAYVLPTATTSVLGGVKSDGATLTNTSGVLSVTYGAGSNTAAQGNDSRITGALSASATTLPSSFTASSLTSLGTITALSASSIAAGTTVTMTGPTGEHWFDTTSGALYDQYTYRNFAAWDAAFIQGFRAHGSASSPTVVSNGDVALNITGSVYDGGAWRQITSIASWVDGTIGASNTPGALSFFTAPPSTVGVVEALRITPQGQLQVMATSGIYITSGTPASTTYGLYNNSGTLTWNGTPLATGSSVSGTTGYLSVFTGSTTLGNSNIFTSGSDTGIGTTSPANLLHVYSTSAAAGFTVDGTTNPALTFAASGSVKGYVGVVTTAGAYAVGSAIGDVVFRAANNLLLSTASGATTGVYVANNGNVAIGGNSAPANALDILTGGGIHITSGVPSSTTAALYNDSGVLTWNGAALATGSTVSGTTGYLSSFSSSTALGNSGLYQSGNSFGFGTTSPGGSVHVVGSNGNGSHLLIAAAGAEYDLCSYRNSADWDGAFFFGKRAHGSIASPSIVASNDAVALWGAQAHDGAAFQYVGAILMSVDGTPGAGSMPGRTMFLTTPSGSTTPLERMRIDKAGNVSIGTTNNSQMLSVEGSLTLGNGGGNLYFRNNANSADVAALSVNNSDNYLYIFSRGSGISFNSVANATLMKLTDSGQLGIGMASSYPLDVAGVIRGSGELISSQPNGPHGNFRMIGGSYGSFFRNDGSYTYLMLTASGDQYGAGNSLRPITVDNATGALSVDYTGAGTSFGGAVTATGTVHGNAGFFTSDNGSNWFGLEPEQTESTPHGSIVNAGSVRLLQFDLTGPYTATFAGPIKTPYGAGAIGSDISGNFVTGGYVTPQMYGADDTGATDCSSALSSAFNSGRPVFMVGKFKITSTVTVDVSFDGSAGPRGVSIFGAGEELSQIILSGTSTNVHFNQKCTSTYGPDNSVNGNAQIVLRDFCVVVATAAHGSSTPGSLFGAIDIITTGLIAGIAINNFSIDNVGVQSDGASGWTYCGLNIQDSRSFRVSGFYSGGGIGAVRNGTAGIGIAFTSTNNAPSENAPCNFLFHGINITSGDYGIRLIPSGYTTGGLSMDWQGCTITDSYLIGQNTASIYAEGTDGACGALIVGDCNLQGGSYGVYTNGVSGVTVTGTTFVGCSVNGIYIGTNPYQTGVLLGNVFVIGGTPIGGAGSSSAHMQVGYNSVF